MKRIALAAVLLFTLVGPAPAGQVRELAPGEEIIPLDPAHSTCLDFMNGEKSLENTAVGLTQCEIAADQLAAVDQFYLGAFYFWGVQYTPQDYAEAATWFQRAASRGHNQSQSKLGNMYLEGVGVPQDYAEAEKWFRRVAEQGMARAQSNLGVMYNNGQGVPQDYIQAHMWLNLAAAQGDETARENRDKLAKKMTPADISKAQAMAREWMEEHQE